MEEYGADGLKHIFSEGTKANFGAFTAISILCFIFYFVFARFREQVCILVCPYGRLQSVLLDSNSLLVAYDFPRGEAKAHFKKGEDRK